MGRTPVGDMRVGHRLCDGSGHLRKRACFGDLFFDGLDNERTQVLAGSRRLIPNGPFELRGEFNRYAHRSSLFAIITFQYGTAGDFGLPYVLHG